MSESEKRKCYFIQYSDEFLYDTKVQKLYGTPNTGKAAIAVYLQLMLVAAKSGGLIVHDYPLYQTLGEQLQPLLLHTSKEEIDSVIHYFGNPDFGGKYIRIVDDIYTFVQAQTMTQSKTIGAINKANQRNKNKSDNVGFMSVDCPPVVRYNNNNSHTDINNNSNNIMLLRNESISEAVIDSLLKEFGEESVAESYEYAIQNMPVSVRNRSGFILNCIRKQLRLTAIEKERIRKRVENIAKNEEQKLKELEAINLASAEAEAEKIATIGWWTMLTEQERQNYWELALVGLNDFTKKVVGDFLMPDDLIKLTTREASIIVPKLTQIRKEQN